MRKKKIKLFINWFKPAYKAGGPIQSVSSIINNLQDYFIFDVITSNRDIDGSLLDVQSNTKLLTNYGSVTYIDKSLIQYINYILRILKSEQDSVLYCNSFFSFRFSSLIILISTLFFNNKIVVAPRGEFSEGALSIKPKKKKMFIRIMKALGIYKNVLFHCTNTQEYDNTKKELKWNIKHDVASNFPNLLNNFKSKNYKKEGILNLLFYGRVARIKNLDFLLKILSNSTLKGKVNLDIYGPIEDSSYWAYCEQLISQVPSSISIKYKSELTIDNKEQILNKYHFFCLPTKGENFGHTIVECMSTGSVPIISDNTPWINLQENRCGWSLNLSDENLFLEVIQRCVNMTNTEWNEISNNVENYVFSSLDIKEIKNTYVKMFNYEH